MGRGNRKLPGSLEEVAIRPQSTATGGTKIQATTPRYFLPTTTTAEALLLDCCTIPPMLPNSEKKQRILSGRGRKSNISAKGLMHVAKVGNSETDNSIGLPKS
ncbi:hypothetical protein TWF506_000723 [Arthrobotrys conoides]|uniref:Uncharacterized protein n=1 Tax=Arthrobotrys conoides TaxID=74498 RepID=A0AAN8RX91_9PEZI